MGAGKTSDLSKWLSGSSKEESRERHPCVLVIDDDDSVLSALKFALRDRYEVRLCAEALGWSRHMDDGVDVVVLDIKMSGRDGFWVYNAIREHYGDVPIIFNSAYQDLRDPHDVMNTFRPFGFI